MELKDFPVVVELTDSCCAILFVELTIISLLWNFDVTVMELADFPVVNCTTDFPVVWN